MGSEHILTRRPSGREAPPFLRRQLLVRLWVLVARRQVGFRLVYWRLQRPHLCLAHLTFVALLLLFDFLFVVEAPNIVQRAVPLLPYERRRVLAAINIFL